MYLCIYSLVIFQNTAHSLLLNSRTIWGHRCMLLWADGKRGETFNGVECGMIDVFILVPSFYSSFLSTFCCLQGSLKIKARIKMHKQLAKIRSCERFVE